MQELTLVAIQLCLTGGLVFVLVRQSRSGVLYPADFQLACGSPRLMYMFVQLPGVSMEQLREQMSKGTVSADELQFFDGECIWAPLQLETELAGGAWICIKVKEEDLVRLQQDQMR